MQYIKAEKINVLAELNTYEKEEQLSIINFVFEYWSSFDLPNKILCINCLKESFFRTMTPALQEKYISGIIEILKLKEDYSFALIEYVGQAIKYAQFDVQKSITDIINIVYEGITLKQTIYVMNFFKYVWNICNDINQKCIENFLNELKKEDDKVSDFCRDIQQSIKAEPIRCDESKIVLLVPEFLTSATFLQQPIDYMIIASILTEKGINVDILDNRVHNYSLCNLKECLRQYEKIIINSSPVDMIQKYYVDYRFCIFCETVNFLKREFPNKEIIVCGAHGSIDRRVLCNDIKCDKVLEGEVVNSVLESILVYRPSSNEIWKRPISVDKICMDAYYGRKIVDGITFRQKNYGILQLSRGCPYECIFCYNIYGKKVERVPVSMAIEWLLQYKKYGVTNVFFIDQTFTLDYRYVTDLCNEIIRLNLSISWQCETRPDLLNEDLLRIMKKAGCKRIWLGFESFSQKVLDENKKGISVEQQIRAVKLLKKIGIPCSGFVMLGMKGDTVETISETIDAIIFNNIPTSRTANICTVRMGTELYEIAKEKNKLNITSFCQLESCRGKLMNSLTERELSDAICYFSKKLG